MFVGMVAVFQCFVFRYIAAVESGHFDLYIVGMAANLKIKIIYL